MLMLAAQLYSLHSTPTDTIDQLDSATSHQLPAFSRLERCRRVVVVSLVVVIRERYKY